MTLPINHIENCRHINQRKQTQIKEYVIHENFTLIDYDFVIADKVLVRKKQAYKYKTLFQGPYEIIKTWKNGTITIRTFTVTSRLNICRTKTYDILEIKRNTSIQFINIHIYATYNVTSICPYI